MQSWTHTRPKQTNDGRYEQKMDDNVQMIPYIAHESAMSRMERTNKRLWILCIIMFLALVGTNAGWIYYESQWIDEETTIEAEQYTDDGGNNYAVGGDMNG